MGFWLGYRGVYLTGLLCWVAGITERTEASCPAGLSQQLNDECYILLPAAESWQDARTRCQQKGGTFPVVNDVGMQLFLQRYMRVSKLNSIWLDGKQEIKDWYWIKDGSSISHQGCYNKRVPWISDMGDLKFTTLITTMVPSKCMDVCRLRGNAYAGIQSKDQCYCGDSYSENGQLVHSSQPWCSLPCPGNGTLYCGGWDINSIYNVNGGYSAWGYRQPGVPDTTCAVMDSLGNNRNFADENCFLEKKYICDIPKSLCRSRSIGYYAQGGSCLFIGGFHSWWKAHHTCIQRRGTLVSIDNILKHELVVTAVKDQNPDDQFWIGLTRSNWTWASSGLPLTYSNWANKSPAKISNLCLTMSRSTGYKWSNEDCDESHVAVCKIPAITTIIPPTTTIVTTNLTTEGLTTKIEATSTVSTLVTSVVMTLSTESDMTTQLPTIETDEASTLRQTPTYTTEEDHTTNLPDLTTVHTDDSSTSGDSKLTSEESTTPGMDITSEQTETSDDLDTSTPQNISTPSYTNTPSSIHSTGSITTEDATEIGENVTHTPSAMPSAIPSSVSFSSSVHTTSNAIYSTQHGTEPSSAQTSDSDVSSSIPLITTTEDDSNTTYIPSLSNTLHSTLSMNMTTTEYLPTFTSDTSTHEISTKPQAVASSTFISSSELVIDELNQTATESSADISSQATDTTTLPTASNDTSTNVSMTTTPSSSTHDYKDTSYRASTIYNQSAEPETNATTFSPREKVNATENVPTTDYATEEGASRTIPTTGDPETSSAINGSGLTRTTTEPNPPSTEISSEITTEYFNSTDTANYTNDNKSNQTISSEAAGVTNAVTPDHINNTLIPDYQSNISSTLAYTGSENASLAENMTRASLDLTTAEVDVTTSTAMLGPGGRKTTKNPVHLPKSTLLSTLLNQSGVTDFGIYEDEESTHDPENYPELDDDRNNSTGGPNIIQTTDGDGDEGWDVFEIVVVSGLVFLALGLAISMVVFLSCKKRSGRRKPNETASRQTTTQNPPIGGATRVDIFSTNGIGHHNNGFAAEHDPRGDDKKKRKKADKYKVHDDAESQDISTMEDIRVHRNPSHPDGTKKPKKKREGSLKSLKGTNAAQEWSTLPRYYFGMKRDNGENGEKSQTEDPSDFPLDYMHQPFPLRQEVYFKMSQIFGDQPALDAETNGENHKPNGKHDSSDRAPTIYFVGDKRLYQNASAYGNLTNMQSFSLPRQNGHAVPNPENKRLYEQAAGSKKGPANYYERKRALYDPGGRLFSPGQNGVAQRAHSFSSHTAIGDVNSTPPPMPGTDSKPKNGSIQRTSSDSFALYHKNPYRTDDSQQSPVSDANRSTILRNSRPGSFRQRVSPADIVVPVPPTVPAKPQNRKAPPPKPPRDRSPRDTKRENGKPKARLKPCVVHDMRGAGAMNSSNGGTAQKGSNMFVLNAEEGITWC